MIATRQPGDGSSQQIAHGLASAIKTALVAHGETPPETRALAWQSAVDIAELLELAGLSALLTACAAHAEDPPLAVANVYLRLARLANETEERGDITTFLEADREMASLAGLITSQDWGAPEITLDAGQAPVSLLPLANLLTELELDRPAGVAAAQVTMQVATALRAALDWIGADEGAAVRVQVQDAALQLSARPTHDPGLRAAGAVLASAGGALVSEPDGRWALRVPLHLEQPAFLLARQGGLALAIPWHAVARLRIADDGARMVMTEPSLVPWSSLERPQGERPAALLAWGLTRAWLHLDHIVWRVFARPEPAETSDAVPGGRHVVRTDDGGTYDVVDVAEALQGVPPLDTPPPRPRPRSGPEPRLVTPGSVVGGSGAGVISGRPGAAEEPAAPLAGAPASEPGVEAEPGIAALLETAPGSEVVERAEEFAPESAAPEPEAEVAEVPGSDEVEAPEVPEAVAAPAPVPAPRMLGPEHVRPLMKRPSVSTAPVTLGASSVTPRTTPSAGAVAVDASSTVPAEPAPVAVRPAEPAPTAARPKESEPADEKALRALIVDDSLVARIALGRALEREGWVVEGVERADEMWQAIESSRWSVVFVDVALPDASGGEHLQALVDRVAGAPHPFELVALTRDESEEEDAFASGIVRTLRKPFTPERLARMVDALPISRGRS